MANTTNDSGALAALGSWLGALAGSDKGTGTSLVKSTPEASPGEQQNFSQDLLGALFQQQPPKEEQAETQPEQKQEQNPDTLQSVLSALTGLSSQKSGTAKNSAGAVAGKMIYQPTPTQFVQYIPPQKKRIAPTSGRVKKA